MTHTKLGVVSAAIFTMSLWGGTALAQDSTPASRFPITPQQRSTADQVAQAGVPLAALAPNAPERYTVKRGDTLWDLSSMYLISPWRWPELWGMNKTTPSGPLLGSASGCSAARPCTSRSPPACSRTFTWSGP